MLRRTKLLIFACGVAGFAIVGVLLLTGPRERKTRIVPGATPETMWMIELQKKTPTCIRIEHRHRGFGEVTDPGKIAKIVKSLLNSYERKSSDFERYQYVINVQWVGRSTEEFSFQLDVSSWYGVMYWANGESSELYRLVCKDGDLNWAFFDRTCIYK